MAQFKFAQNQLATTTHLINVGSFPNLATGEVIKTMGYASKGDGGGDLWRKTGNTGTASQSPIMTGDNTLFDANGDEWELVDGGMFNSLAVAGTDGIQIPVLQVNDSDDTLRDALWVQGRALGSVATVLDESHVNNILAITGSNDDYEIPVGLGANGSIVTIIVESATGNTVSPGSGLDLIWLQGGSTSTGTRTIALGSEVTLRRSTSTRWTISGIGIT